MSEPANTPAPAGDSNRAIRRIVFWVAVKFTFLIVLTIVVLWWKGFI